MYKINILELAKDENNRLILRNNLCYIIKYLGLTEIELAKMVGVTRQTISEYKNKHWMIKKNNYISLLSVIVSFVDSNIELYDRKLIYKMLTREIESMETVYNFEFKD